jgi:hypothetical protein
MTFLVNHPILTFVVTVLFLWLSFFGGTMLRKRRSDMAEEERRDYGVLLAATLTLLGLIIAFTFSMAGTRYDQRKNLEEEEANAIGTEYMRADLLPTDAAEKVRGLLRSYLDQRILFYTSSGDQLREINAITRQTPSRTLGGCENSCWHESRRGRGAHAFGNERCSKLPGLHASSLAESHPYRSMVSHVGHRHLLQPDDWFLYKTQGSQEHPTYHANRHRRRLCPHCGY